MVYGAVPVEDEENPLLGVRSSSKRPRSFACGVIAVVCVAALAISGVSRATDESSREDHLSALGDLSNAYLAQRSWWRDVKTANETLVAAKRASDEAMEAAAEAEEKLDELTLDAEEKDRACADIRKAEDQTSGCDDHCSTGAVQASRLGWGSWSRSVSSWWRSVAKRAAEAAKKAAEAKKKAKCMETCKSLDCGLPQCKKDPKNKCPPGYRWCKTGFDMYTKDSWGWRRIGITGIGDKRVEWVGKGTSYYFPARRTNKCTEKVVTERTAASNDRGFGMRETIRVGVGSDYLSECGKCTD